MLHPVTFRVLAVAACGWLLACDALALSLGRASSVALIGRPLDLAVTVADATAGKPCAQADVFYGDNRVGTGVDVAWEPGAGGSGVLRVRSATPVDEPMVTVYLRAGCANATTRRYVLLSEPPAEVALAAFAAPVQAPTPAAAPAAGATPSPTAPKARRDNAGRGSPAARPRLRLEPLDLSIDRDPVLRLSPELRSEVATDPQRRAQAAALWKALQRDPDQAVQEALRLQGAERELRSAREAMQRNAVAVGQLRGEIEQAGRSRSSASVAVVSLALVLFALLAWLAWRWLRETRITHVRHWFEANSELAQPPMPIVDAAAARRMNVPTQPPAFAAVSAPAPAPRPSAVPAPAPPARAQTAAPAEALAPVAQPSRGPARSVGVEELIDLHDKADFFLSIGEHRQAIGALEAHVHDNVETSALAWLDLLELYHRFGQRPEYERLRAEFQERFDVQVPEFEHFDLPAAPLEAHTDVLGRIVDLWPTRRVLDVIAEALFRKPGLPGAEPFGLEACRELVFLYHVARDLVEQEETVASSGAAAGDFDATGLQPLQALDEPSGGESKIDPRMVPPSSRNLGVDIELVDDAPSSSGLPLDFDVSGYEPSPKDAPKAR